MLDHTIGYRLSINNKAFFQYYKCNIYIIYSPPPSIFSIFISSVFIGIAYQANLGKLYCLQSFVTLENKNLLTSRCWRSL